MSWPRVPVCPHSNEGAIINIIFLLYVGTPSFTAASLTVYIVAGAMVIIYNSFEGS